MQEYTSSMDAAYRRAEYKAQFRDLLHSCKADPEAMLNELESRQKNLRQRLEDFEQNFILQHGRPPTKAESESEMHHLKENLTFVDSQIRQVGIMRQLYLL